MAALGTSATADRSRRNALSMSNGSFVSASSRPSVGRRAGPRDPRPGRRPRSRSARLAGPVESGHEQKPPSIGQVLPPATGRHAPRAGDGPAPRRCNGRVRPGDGRPDPARRGLAARTPRGDRRVRPSDRPGRGESDDRTDDPLPRCPGGGSRAAAAVPTGRSLRIVGVRLVDDGRTLVLATDPHPRVARYLLPLAGGAASYDLTGLEAAWSELDDPGRGSEVVGLVAIAGSRHDPPPRRAAPARTRLAWPSSRGPDGSS